MITLLSPAKTLDYESEIPQLETSSPAFIEDADYLNNKLKKLSSRKIAKLMNLSTDLAELNYERYQSFQTPFNDDNARPAIYAFKGDVYTGLDAGSLSGKDISFAQEHVRILSGLYGLLKPLDLMQPYRLEMGTSFAVTPKKKNLYAYWDKKITEKLNAEIKDETVINLASAEYFKVVKPKLLNAKVITPQFLDAKGGEYKMIGFFAKKARGMMTRYIIKNRIDSPEELKGFNLEGYNYNESLSEEDKPVFTREENW